MVLKTSILHFLLFISFTILAQHPVILKAERSFTNGDYFEAAQQITEAYDKISPKSNKAKKQKAEMAYRAGYSYEKIFNFEQAIDWYERAIILEYYNIDPSVYYNLANIQRQKGNYSLAKENYQKFLALVPGDKLAEKAIQSLDKASILKDNMTRYAVKNELKINSDNMDMALVMADRRGSLVAFGSTRKSPVFSSKDPIMGEPYFNIWQVEIDRSGNWTQPELLADVDSVNTEHNEGTIAFDGGFRKMFITRCPKIKDYALGCRIYVSDRRGRSWSIPTRVEGIQENDTISVGHPCPTEDGMAMIFSGDIPGGYGGKDLWYSTYNRREDTWSEPVNLGPEINTPGDELFPTFGLNGDLFFASNGHVGLGGLDIYRAKKIGGDDEFKWENPKNMGTPINSDADDYHLTEVDSENGFFTSNRKGSLGAGNLADIWSYELPPSIFDLKVIVNNLSGEGRIEGATIEVESDDGEQSFSGVTNADGFVYFDKNPEGERLIKENSTYKLKILPLEGFHINDNYSEFSTVGINFDQNFIVELGLLPKTPIVLPEVRYDLNSAVLQVREGEINSRDSLNFVFDLLEEYPGMVLKLMSHTDSRGTEKSNEDLAQRRAQSCVDYLVKEKGVEPSRLEAVGKGENEPRTVYLIGDPEEANYRLTKPRDGKEGEDYEKIVLTEEYINQYKENDEERFERLHQYNRRTEAEVIRMDWTPDDKPVE